MGMRGRGSGDEAPGFRGEWGHGDDAQILGEWGHGDGGIGGGGLSSSAQQHGGIRRWGRQSSGWGPW